MNKNYDNFEKTTCTTKIKDIKDGYYSFDETVFYGEKGGQLADQGTINGLPVTDLKYDGGTLYHQVAGKLHNPIKMVVDPQTRLINTTVQSVFHLLDGYYEGTGIKVTEVNANPENQWYEIDSKKVTTEDLQKVEDWMNQVIQQNVQTTFTYVNGKDYPDPNYRKYPQVRLVHLGKINVQPCGTLHVNHTSQIQSFVILGTEKVAGGTKIYITTNLVTNRRLHQDEEILNNAAKQLSVRPEAIGKKLQETLTKEKQVKKQLKAVQQELMTLKAQQIVEQNGPIAKIKISSASDLSLLAPAVLKITKRPQLLVAPFANKTFLAIISPTGQAREELAEMKNQLSINGGGSPKMVTGNTLSSVDEVIQSYSQSKK